MVRLHPSPPDVDGSSIGRALDCDSDGCEFDSHPSTQAGVAQLVEHLICNEKVVGSNPITSSTASSSSFGLGHYPVTVKTWVRIPLRPPPLSIIFIREYV